MNKEGGMEVFILKLRWEACEMAQRVWTQEVEPWTHMLKDNELMKTVLWSSLLYVMAYVCRCVHTHNTHNQSKNIYFKNFIKT